MAVEIRNESSYIDTESLVLWSKQLVGLHHID